MSKWEMVKLGEVAKTQSGYSFKSDEFQKDGIPIIRIGNLDGESVIVDYDICYYKKFWDEHSEFRIYYGDILIAMSGATVGKIGIYEQNNPALLNQRVGKITPHSDKLYNKYLYSYVKSELFLGKIRAAAFGCAQPNISGKQITDIKIPLPPLEEQKRIADILDKASNLIDLRKQQLEKMDLLIKSKFIDMFGDPVTNPKGWEVKKLVEVTNKIGSGSTPRGGKESYIEEGISLIRSMNVHDGRFKYDQLAYIDEVQAKQMDIVAVIENDVLINITGASVARSCVVPKELLPARVNQHVSIVRCICEKVNPIYLNQLFISDSYKSVLLAVGGAGGATREAITKQQLEKLDILIPPIKLQNQFATFVEQIEKQKVVMQQSLEKMEMNYKALMQEYFG